MNAFLDHRVRGPQGAITLRFGFNAFAAFEAESGTSAFVAIARLERGELQMASDLRRLCWAAMLHHHPDAVPEDAGLLLDHDPVCVHAALKIAMPDAEAGGDAPAKKPRAFRRVWRSFFGRGSVPV